MDHWFRVHCSIKSGRFLSGYRAPARAPAHAQPNICDARATSYCLLYHYVMHIWWRLRLFEELMEDAVVDLMII